jgi:hypothetical protein
MGLVIFCVFILVVNIVMWIFCFKLFRKSFSAKGVLNDMKQEASKIILEINRQTDSAITLMEANINQVREIIETADKKIMLYENTLIQKENERQLYQQLTEFQQGTTPIQRAVKVYSLNDISDKTEPMHLFTENAGTSDLKKSKAMKKSNSEAKSQDTLSQNFELDFSEKNEGPKIQETQKIQPKVPIQQQIIELANQGITADLIAAKLNISISEVTMTIDLFL